jgi:hypothetical protein
MRKNSHTKPQSIETSSPVHKERLGALEAAVWENQVGEGTRMRVTLSKSFKDAEGTWQRTHSLDAADLPLAQRLLERSEAWIANRQQQAAEVDQEEELER